jgi:hypothetical protein
MTWSLQEPSVELSRPRSDHRKFSAIVTTHCPRAFPLQVVLKVLSHFLNLQNLNMVAEPLVLPAPAHLIHNIQVLLLILNMVLLLFLHLVVLHLIALPLVPLPLVLLPFLFVAHLLVGRLLIVLSCINHTLVILLLVVLLPVILLLVAHPLVALLLVILLLVAHPLITLLLVVLLLVILPLVALLLVVLLLVVLPLVTLLLVILVTPSPIVVHCLLKPVVAVAGNMYVIIILIVPALILACFLGLSTL